VEFVNLKNVDIVVGFMQLRDIMVEI